MLRNVRTTRIEWCDCDPAGIIFYPRYFEIFDTGTTALFERALGMSKIDYLKAFDFAGHPVVETRARFRQPTRFGDDISIETKLVECSESTLKLEHRISKGGALAVEGLETRAWVTRDATDPWRMQRGPIPKEVIARLRQAAIQQAELEQAGSATSSHSSRTNL
jgi:4-hydroxybenzoyl-CoA thioesterase